MHALLKGRAQAWHVPQGCANSCRPHARPTWPARPPALQHGSSSGLRFPLNSGCTAGQHFSALLPQQAMRGIRTSYSIHALMQPGLQDSSASMVGLTTSSDMSAGGMENRQQGVAQ